MIENVSNFKFESEISMKVLKLHESLVDFKESHENVLKDVISSNIKMQIHINQTFETAQKKIQDIDSIQNSLNLLKNETEGRFDDILGQTESFFKKVYDYFTAPFYVFWA